MACTCCAKFQRKLPCRCLRSRFIKTSDVVFLLPLFNWNSLHTKLLLKIFVVLCRIFSDTFIIEFNIDCGDLSISVHFYPNYFPKGSICQPVTCVQVICQHYFWTHFELKGFLKVCVLDVSSIFNYWRVLFQDVMTNFGFNCVLDTIQPSQDF